MDFCYFILVVPKTANSFRRCIHSPSVYILLTHELADRSVVSMTGLAPPPGGRGGGGLDSSIGIEAPLVFQTLTEILTVQTQKYITFLVKC